MARRVRIAAVGEACLDTFDPEGDSHLGGISVNFARAAQLSGVSASVFAAVGDDAVGETLRALLAGAPVDATHVRTERGASSQQRVRVGPGGERVLAGFVPGVAASYAPSDEEIALLEPFDAIAVPWSPDTATWVEKLVAVFGERDDAPLLACDVSIDSEPGTDVRAWVLPVVDHFDVVFVGGRLEHVEVLTEVAGVCRALVVLTAGRDGAYALGGEVAAHQPTLATTVVDTLGCGDAFQGGFIAALTQGESVEQALLVGATRAAEAAARRGA